MPSVDTYKGKLGKSSEKPKAKQASSPKPPFEEFSQLSSFVGNSFNAQAVKAQLDILTGSQPQQISTPPTPSISPAATQIVEPKMPQASRPSNVVPSFTPPKSPVKTELLTGEKRANTIKEIIFTG